MALLLTAEDTDVNKGVRIVIRPYISITSAITNLCLFVISVLFLLADASRLRCEEWTHRDSGFVVECQEDRRKQRGKYRDIYIPYP